MQNSSGVQRFEYVAFRVLRIRFKFFYAVRWLQGMKFSYLDVFICFDYDVSSRRRERGRQRRGTSDNIRWRRRDGTNSSYCQIDYRDVSCTSDWLLMIRHGHSGLVVVAPVRPIAACWACDAFAEENDDANGRKHGQGSAEKDDWTTHRFAFRLKWNDVIWRVDDDPVGFFWSRFSSGRRRSGRMGPDLSVSNFIFKIVNF